MFERGAKRKTEVIIAKKDPIRLIFILRETKTNRLHVLLRVTEAVLFFSFPIYPVHVVPKNYTNVGDEEESPAKVPYRKKAFIIFIERVMARYSI